jgi:hypothetical protein
VTGRFAAVILTLAFTSPALAAANDPTLPSSTHTPIVFYRLSAERMAGLIASEPANDNERYKGLRRIFSSLRCPDDQLEEQSVPGSEQPNLICSLPATEREDASTSRQSAIVIGAEYTHMHNIDNWSSAVMLPLLFASLQPGVRRRTIVFAAFAGPRGAATFIKQYRNSHQPRIEAMIDLDALGFAPPSYWALSSDEVVREDPACPLAKLLRASALALKQASIPRSFDSGRYLDTDQTAAFRYASIPAITVHSISSENLAASRHDPHSAFDMDRYYETYNLLCVFTLTVDHIGDGLPSAVNYFASDQPPGAPPQGWH